jgi:hypothetical protein
VSRRSPLNPRYQKYTEPEGKTRKSAAAAKPTRKRGEAGAPSKDKSKSAAKPGGKYAEPDTPEYKFWRRAWWISLGAGLVFVAIAFYVEWVLKATGPLRIVGTASIVLAYVCIAVSFIIDFRRIRPMRLGTYKPREPADKSASKSE